MLVTETTEIRVTRRTSIGPATDRPATQRERYGRLLQGCAHIAGVLLERVKPSKEPGYWGVIYDDDRAPSMR